MPKKKDPRKPFNLLLSVDEYAMLYALSTESGTSCGAVLRAALRAKYAHTVDGIPTCAGGTPCFVPQMHIPKQRNNTPAA